MKGRAVVTPVDVSLSTGMQVLAVANAWLIKPVYMLLCIYVIRKLWRSAAPDLALVRRGVVVFLIGETACAVNYLLYGMASVGLELVHGAGMALAGGILCLGLFEAVDRRVLFQFVDGAACSVLRLCGSCPVREQGKACRFVPLFVLACLGGAFVAMAPLTRPAVARHAMRMMVFGHPYVYDPQPLQQLFEHRFCPIVAVLLLLTAALVLVGRRSARPKLERVLFCFGLGFGTFGVFRFALHHIYLKVPIWAEFWEESTELLAIVGIVVILHVFWDRLGSRTAANAIEE